MKTGKHSFVIYVLSMLALFLGVRWAVARKAVVTELQVKSNQVLVPTFVYNLRTLDTPAPPSASAKQACAALAPLYGLTAKDFRLFDDGVEQKIQNVTVQRWPLWWAFDSLGSSMLYISTPKAKWSTVDLPTSFSGPFCPSDFYQLAFVPPPSLRGSCHTIKVTVNRKQMIVWNRKLYCNVPHSPSDPLKGTPFGRQMESDLTLRKPGKIHLSLQAGFFYTGANRARLYLALAFPWQSLWSRWKKGKLYASIAVLGMVYRKNGAVAARFSSWWWDSHDFPDFVQRTPENSQNAYPSLNFTLLPAQCETEVDLPPGQYKLRVVLSDGKKYGRVTTPLDIPRHDANDLGLSSIFLARRYHTFTAATPEPSRFVPLLTNAAIKSASGMKKSTRIEVVPAGKTDFMRGSTLMAYFQLYEPQVGEDQDKTLKVHMRITSLATGKVLKEFTPFSIAPYEKAGSRMIGIGRSIPLGKLRKGKYQLEVEASDSVGMKTPWRSADFTIGHVRAAGFSYW